MQRRPVFYKTVYSQDELDDCFDDLIHSALCEQDKIEVGCLVQYFAILRHHGLLNLPIDFIKNRQGEGPDFTVVDNGGVTGVEMTKVTTADYQVWLKRNVNYRPIHSISDYSDDRPERRVADLAKVRVLKKNYKIFNYFAAVPEMQHCDLVLEEDGDCCMDPEVLMQLLQQRVRELPMQKYRTISMISGSILYYAINSSQPIILKAPEFEMPIAVPSFALMPSAFV